MTNNRIPLSPPVIRAVGVEEHRPLWSVMIPVYNCSKFIPKVLESVLAQDPGEELMQIEVVDDGSTDADVRKIVERIGKGRIGYYRQERNVGSLWNFETCIQRSKGYWVHLLHGDDFVSPGFYEEIKQLFSRYPDAGAAFTGFNHVDAGGNILYPNAVLADKPGYVANWQDLISQTQCIQPPAIVLRREVYERLGSFFGVHYGEDWEMWVRVSYNFPVVHSPRQLANYRIHDNNITSNYFLSGQHIKDIQKVIGMIQGYFPAEKRKRLRKLAERNFSIYFARTSDMVYHGYRQHRLALRQAIAALRMDVNPITFYFVLKISLKLLIRYRH
ncbi:MAG: glycosyltransferase [Bacteroidetes bacterium]|nr:glycosyltransferase [Bacteroidota bacterium]